MTIQQLYLTELKKKPNYNERKNNSVVMRKNDRNWKNLGSINVATPGIEYWCLCYQSCGFFSIEGLLIGLHSTGHYDLLVHWPMGGKVQCKLFSVLHTLCSSSYLGEHEAIQGEMGGMSRKKLILKHQVFFQ